MPKGDGCLRVCGDYKVTIDSTLVVDKYPLPKPEDLMAQLASGQKFSKLVLSQQILLTDDSQKLVKINTHLGQFQYIRVLISIASIIYSCIISENNEHSVAGYSKYTLLPRLVKLMLNTYTIL